MDVLNKKIITGIVGIIVIMVVMICLLKKPVYKWRREKWNEKRKEYLMEQQRLKQELEPFMEDARKVMRGEVTATGELALYNFEPEDYENVTELDANAEIIVADIHGDRGSIVITYYIRRLNKNGKCISSESSDASVWIVSKTKEGKWKLEEDPDPIGGNREEAERLLKKMIEYGIVEYNENQMIEFYSDRMP